MFPLLLLALNSDPVPLVRAHAHNDYAHRRPLLDALDQGFCSVEADVFLVDGELRVGHNRSDLQAGRTLEKLYLDPLLQRVRSRHGHVYEKGAPFTLLVDIKADGSLVYAALKERLPRYREMLSRVEPLARSRSTRAAKSKVHAGAVTIVLSGERPLTDLPGENRRLAFLDGRFADDATLTPSPDVTPLVSESFEGHFKWDGRGAMPFDEAARLQEMVEQTHSRGQRLRFWAVPDRSEAWETLYAAGVDLINTDDLSGLGDFLRRKLDGS